MRSSTLTAPVTCLLATLSNAQVVTSGSIAVAPSCTSDISRILTSYPNRTSDLNAAPGTTLAPDLRLRTDRCKILAALPTSSYSKYFVHEGSLQQWWQYQGSNFSQWASTCTGTLARNPYGSVANAYLSQTFMDSFRLTPVACNGAFSTVVEPTSYVITQTDRTFSWTAPPSTSSSEPTSSSEMASSGEGLPRETGMAGAALVGVAAAVGLVL